MAGGELIPALGARWKFGAHMEMHTFRVVPPEDSVSRSACFSRLHPCAGIGKAVPGGAKCWFVVLRWAEASFVSASPRHQAARLPARPRRSASRRTQEPPSISREQFWAGAGTNQEHPPSRLLQVRAPGKLRLTTRSSGQINRFAIDAAA
jgi:hypothetical protein